MYDDHCALIEVVYVIMIVIFWEYCLLNIISSKYTPRALQDPWAKLTQLLSYEQIVELGKYWLGIGILLLLEEPEEDIEENLSRHRLIHYLRRIEDFKCLD